MPTQKEILASIDQRLALLPQIAADVKKLLPAQPQPPEVTPPVVVPPPVVAPPTGPAPAGSMTVAEMHATKLVVPYDKSAVVNVDAPPTYTIGSSWVDCGLTRDMGASGERQEIGVETDAIADFLMGGSSQSMIAQAEAHIREVGIAWTMDGKVVDAIKYPNAQAYGDKWKGEPVLTVAGSVRPEWAHYPSLFYVPFLATGDVKYLRWLQYVATFQIVNAPPDYRGFGQPYINDIQHRGLAWGLREVAKAYLATLLAETRGPLPADLLPSSYWKQILANIRARMEGRWLNNTLAKNSGILPSDQPWAGCVAPWQHDYISQTLGWMIYTGRFPEWRPLYEFQVRQAITRATGPLRSQCLGYEMRSDGATTWEGVLALNTVEDQPMNKPTSDGNTHPYWAKNSPHYIGLLRASLALAVKNNVANAGPAFAYADQQARRVFIEHRHAIAA